VGLRRVWAALSIGARARVAHGAHTFMSVAATAAWCEGETGSLFQLLAQLEQTSPGAAQRALLRRFAETAKHSQLCSHHWTLVAHRLCGILALGDCVQ
jgi:hypothetical protein